MNLLKEFWHWILGYILVHALGLLLRFQIMKWRIKTLERRDELSRQNNKSPDL